jgi:hypothetical protein
MRSTPAAGHDGATATSSVHATAITSGNASQITKWEGRGLARFRCAARFQSPPVKPGMRFSGTRLTDVLHRRYSAFPRQSRKGLGGMTIRWRLASPR